MIRKPRLLCTAGFVLALAACETSTGVSGSEISQADANELAAALDDNATLGTNDFGLGPSFSLNVGENASAAVSVPVTFNNDFSVTKQCPRGGHVAIAGNISGSGDRAAHDLSVHVTATRIDSDCAFQTRGGVLTLHASEIDYEGNLNIVGGQLSGVQTQTHEGSFTWSRPGGSGSCEVDLASSYNPATRTATVTGRFCGHNVNVSRTRG